jgi:hypothetical protein
MTDKQDQQAQLVMQLTAQISPLLSGKGPDVQSAVLADLVAMWLAGHQDLENPESAFVLELREQAFALWCETVRALVPVNVAMLRERHSLDE